MHYRLVPLLVSLVGLLMLGACGSDVKDTHPDQLVTKRKAIFKQITKTLEPIGIVARGRQDYKPGELKISALELEKLASQPWPLFTADSNYAPTLAKSAVWEKPAEFKLAQDKFQKAVANLVLASKSNDLETIKVSVNEVEKSCKSCHDQFRNQR